MDKVSLYNTNSEIAVRFLIILNKYKKPIDLETLLIIDYLSLHINTVDEEIDSLHPDNPLFGIEIVTKNSIAKESVNLLLKKGLINLVFSDEGIKYSYKIISDHFLSFFDGKYYSKLTMYIEKVISIFSSDAEEDIQNFVNRNIDKWYGRD
ncbi:ABC-three component system middle component 2 [Metaclostridioides mangenotii]|uniref:ABC-three component system middle component 2 n=1 Tax=Metaclostridioides mangenotii TaxID=1540 RepID=UPI0028E65D71|nr:ABC-three component system middle component 2 [Clostridioides mangenotii]